MGLQLLSHAEQVAAHLREEILRGRWTGTLPGILALSKRLEVNHNTIDAALQLLEQEGLLVPQGSGRPRRIEVPASNTETPKMTVRMLLYESAGGPTIYDVEILHRLQELGLHASFASRSLHDLGMDVTRVARYVRKTPADAWIVCAASREILEWFAEQDFPTLAMFGRPSGLPLASASPRKAPALAVAVKRLVEFGHRRIVMIAREERLVPKPALFEQAFLDELEAQGVPTGSYNLPVWKDNKASFHKCLDSLFQHTPPTALIVSEPQLFIAAQQHLANLGIVAPRDVSLVCDDPDPTFTWCDPAISHIRWDPSQIVRRVLRWANRVARGQEDLRQFFTKGEFVEGGTIGPAPQ